MKWFQPTPLAPKPQVPQEPLNYPVDVVVETESGHYLIKRTNAGVKKMRFFSQKSFDSWNYVALVGSDASVSKYKNAGVLGFRNGTLVKNFADGRYYLISENKRRHIVSPEVFDKYGLDINQTYLVSQAEIDIHDEGEVLS